MHHYAKIIVSKNQNNVVKVNLLCYYDICIIVRYAHFEANAFKTGKYRPNVFFERSDQVKKRLFALILGLLMIVSMFAGCGEEEPSKPSGPAIEITPSGDGTSAPEGTASTPEASQSGTSQEEVIITEEPTVETEYGTLYYHEQWLGLMKIEQNKEGENVIVSFEGEADGARYPLFTIIIGSSDESYVGEITDASGAKHEVFAVFEDLEQYINIAQEDYDRLCAMQEDLNFVIENLK